MRVAFLTHCLPQPDVSGGAKTCWAILQALKEAGHQSDLYYMKEKYDDSDTPARRELLKPIIDNLFVLNTLESGEVFADKKGGIIRRAKERLIAPSWPILFPTYLHREKMKSLMAENSPDVIFIYHWLAAAGLYGLHPAPKMVVTGDLSHKPAECRWKLTRPSFSKSYFKQTLLVMRDGFYHPRRMADIMNDAEVGGSFGSFDADYVKRRGAPGSRYFQTPIVDPIGPDYQTHRTSTAPKKFRILAGISNLQATSTSSGIKVIAKEILPMLEKEFGQDRFEIHVVGGGKPPEELARLLPRPTVKMKGFVDSVDPEYLAADIVLSPTPVYLGFRTRIITAFAFGCCVVANYSEAHNMPEMVHQKNALLAHTGRDIGQWAIRALKEETLRRRIGEDARKTYEENFSAAKSCAKLINELEQLAAGKKETAAR